MSSFGNYFEIEDRTGLLREFDRVGGRFTYEEFLKVNLENFDSILGMTELVKDEILGNEGFGYENRGELGMDLDEKIGPNVAEFPMPQRSAPTNFARNEHKQFESYVFNENICEKVDKIIENNNEERIAEKNVDRPLPVGQNMFDLPEFNSIDSESKESMPQMPLNTNSKIDIPKTTSLKPEQIGKEFYKPPPNSLENCLKPDRTIKSSIKSEQVNKPQPTSLNLHDFNKVLKSAHKFEESKKETNFKSASINPYPQNEISKKSTPTPELIKKETNSFQPDSLKLNSQHKFSEKSDLKPESTTKKLKNSSPSSKSSYSRPEILEKNSFQPEELKNEVKNASSNSLDLYTQPKITEKKSPSSNKSPSAYNRPPLPRPVAQASANPSEKNLAKPELDPKLTNKYQSNPKNIPIPSINLEKNPYRGLKPNENQSKNHSKRLKKQQNHRSNTLNHSPLGIKSGARQINPQNIEFRENDMSYENLLLLNSHDYDPGNGFNFETLSNLNQFIFQSFVGEVQICNICQENLECGQNASLLNCGHIFHYDCIYDWLSRKKKCAFNCVLEENDFLV